MNYPFISIDIVVGDIGYISSEQKMELRRQLHTAVLTRVRENMYPPEKYIDYGRPECPEGIPLSWNGYNSETEMHCYITPIDNPACISCCYILSASSMVAADILFAASRMTSSSPPNINLT